ncbi:A disintegrin and metalloproteinase with thrombospondin motifs 9 [Merluccius polli]|uniref:A disintegrin and metalloproteinase with thrombospondin motifs 9 n=1 Tax=Merluccius polli TaxID=89951 RepID=A0AA47MBK7_MERPO|nr:A disintegrin and metalloproteinase with thrombospondin motifs 9 [Merluccius polli]
MKRCEKHRLYLKTGCLEAGTGYGECLLDEPTARMYEMPTLLPGQLYNANRQCELMFGPGSQVCPYMPTRWYTADIGGSNPALFARYVYQWPCLHERSVYMKGTTRAHNRLSTVYRSGQFTRDPTLDMRTHIPVSDLYRIHCFRNLREWVGDMASVV